MRQLDSIAVYNAYLLGARKVIEHKNLLNKINVFPVADGDTGSNLFSMMNSIIHEAKIGNTVKRTMESIAEAALMGARGNSGLIFAGYLGGMSRAIWDEEIISIENFAQANQEAVRYAYEAIENPVEGTMITLMKEWAKHLNELVKEGEFSEKPLSEIEERLEYTLSLTKDQLPELKKAGVVDSGAKGFVYFIKGIIESFHGKHSEKEVFEEEDEDATFQELDVHQVGEETLTHRFCTEVLIRGTEIDTLQLKESLKEYGDSLVVAGSSNKARIHLHTNDPASLIERLTARYHVIYQKIDDMKRQQEMVHHKKYKIALITDSIADLPMDFIDEEQIHMINLNILLGETTFLDKLTINTKKLFELAKDKREHPTSSQPDLKRIENLYQYLLTYYEEIVVLTVSKELSGTYNNMNKVAQSFVQKGHRIEVVDTKQNSGAQGLIVMEVAKAIKQEVNFEQVVALAKQLAERSRILVTIKTIEPMIRSGRLSVNAGKVAKFIGLKPVITLTDGKGAIDAISFSQKGSVKQVVNHMRKILRSNQIKTYSIVHVNNEEEAKQFAEIFTKVIGKEPAYIDQCSSVIGVGAGQGAVALSYILE
ncbi:MAG: DegV family EDD domain-containing protein [Vallitaleaceae bacterium]|nr:DegV family EDD domain-containing protein [Vallitaleaceae bacterium]